MRGLSDRPVPGLLVIALLVGSCARESAADQPTAVRWSITRMGLGPTCVMGTEGRVVCWGYEGDSVLAVPDVTFSDFACGVGYACCGLLRDTGALECWGGDNSHGERDVPAGPFGELFGAFNYGGCALTTEHEVVCWGDVDPALAAGPGDPGQISFRPAAS